VEVGRRWKSQKWGAHAGNTPNNEYNNYGIGICLVGDFRQRLPSKAQLDSLDRLVVYLMKTYDIPPENVIGHRDAPGTATECPGDALHAYVHTEFRREIIQQTQE
jgi:N-acetyl-anhydromuramyl-L-alanine amidase AmpD